MLQSADAACSTLFGPDDIALWPSGALEALVRAGLLKQASHATSVVCDGCEEACLSDVEFIGGEEGTPLRAYVICKRREDIGRVEVPVERLRRWGVDLGGMAAVIAQNLGAVGGVEELLEGRLWWLGRAPVGRRRVDFFLARGAAWPDAEATFAEAGRLRECSAPIVLSTWRAPAHNPFPAGGKVLSLARLLSLEGDEVRLDTSEIVRVAGKMRVSRTQAVAPFQTPADMTWNRLIIEFANDEVVKVTAGGVVDHKTFADMGFVDRRKSDQQPQPDELWGHLRTLAEHDGRIAWKDPLRVSSRERYKVKKWIGDIRARLRAFFPGIPGDPFEPYRKVRAYQTKFILRWADEYRRAR